MDANIKVDHQDRLHSVETASELLGGVSQSTIRSWLTQGKLTRIKVGNRLTRIRESELLALIDTGRGDRASARPSPSHSATPKIVA